MFAVGRVAGGVGAVRREEDRELAGIERDRFRLGIEKDIVVLLVERSARCAASIVKNPIVSGPVIGAWMSMYLRCASTFAPASGVNDTSEIIAQQLSPSIS